MEVGPAEMELVRRIAGYIRAGRTGSVFDQEEMLSDGMYGLTLASLKYETTPPDLGHVGAMVRSHIIDGLRRRGGRSRGTAKRNAMTGGGWRYQIDQQSLRLDAYDEYGRSGADFIADPLAGDAFAMIVAEDMLAHLSSREAHVIRSHYLDHSTFGRVGADMQISLSRAQQLAERGLAKLKATLEPEPGDGPKNEPRAAPEISHAAWADVYLKQPTSSSATISPCERDILRLTASGLENPAIAATLHIKFEAVKYLKVGLLRKLEANNITHAIAVAYRHGIIGGPTAAKTAHPA